MNNLHIERVGAFASWMRTGRWPGSAIDGGPEFKFNPYHDPRNGQFTFAPGGPRSLSRVIISHGRGKERRTWTASPSMAASQAGAAVNGNVRPRTEADSAPTLVAAVYRPGVDEARYEDVSRSSRGGNRRGSNSGAFHDPMTLEQAFPGLSNSPGGAIVAVAENLFDLAGPARAATTALAQNWSNQLIAQIKVLEPGYRYDSFGFPQTLQGQISRLNDLRWTRASAFLRKNGELRPLQVETLRAMQESADRAYDKGLKLLRAGKLKVRLSSQETLGNYIDAQVRRDMRRRFSLYGIDSAGPGPVRVNRQENNSVEGTYRRPDARVGNIAYDVTLSSKTSRTPQVRGFFGADFKPMQVVIVRPRQLGGIYTYAIAGSGGSR